MASACVNPVGMSPDSFLDCAPAKYPSYGWLSPRASYSREFPDEADTAGNKRHSLRLDAAENSGGAKEEEEDSDPELSVKDVGDFEFRLDDPVLMLPADELFYDGKLMPLHLSMVRTAAAAVPAAPTASAEVRSPDTPKLRIRNEISSTDPYVFSPKAPRCSSRWKELLGLKKLYQNSNTRPDNPKLASSSSLLNNSGHKTLKNFLNRTSKSMNSSIDASLSLPLLRDSDNESLSVSSRLSLSSSSSGHEHDDLPRLSLDSEKPNGHTRNSSQNINPPRARAVRPRASSSENPTSTATRIGRSPMRRAPDATTTTAARGVSVDSPRMNSSGKIVFHSLERSSSSPSSFNGGPRYKLRGMERSYSANVRVTPVLNVPVCSLRGSSKSGGVFGFPLFSSSSSQPRKESGSSSIGNGSSGGNKCHQSISKHRTDRIKE